MKYLKFTSIIGELNIINISMKNIILLHGALGSSEDLAPLSAVLENLGLSVHPLSFSGHGTKPFGSSFGIQQFALELKEFIRSRNLQEVSVFGYSMGGFVALYLASGEKTLIRKIITLGTKFNWSQASVEKETKLLDPALMLEKVPAFAAMLEKKHGGSWKELVTRTAEMMREISAKEFLRAGTISSLELPVLLGLGDRDQMVSLEETMSVYKALPQGAMYMLPGTRHQLEAAPVDLLSRQILEFVNKV